MLIRTNGLLMPHDSTNVLISSIRSLTYPTPNPTIVYNPSMALILTHEKTDFDAVASMLGARKLYPAAVALLPRHLNRNVQQFLNLYWDALPFMRADDWRKRPIDSVILVDTQALGNVRGLSAHPAVHVIDHHMGQPPKPGWTYEVEPLGATTTLLVERLQGHGLVLAVEEATLLLLGIYEDTGGLTYDTTTLRKRRATLSCAPCSNSQAAARTSRTVVVS